MPNVWTCASADRDDVNDYAGDGAFAGSVMPGDTVIIPADDATWTENITITKGIYLRGAGIGLTNITDSITKDGTDDSCPILAFWPGDEYLDISGFTLIGDAADPTVPEPIIYNKGYLVLSSTTDQSAYPNGNVRIHDIRVDPAHQPFLRTENCVYGVMDRVTYIQGARNIIGEIYHPTCFSSEWGDGSWANEIDWGGPGAFYVENCTINHATTGSAHYTLDQFKGSRTVYRYNTFNNCTISSHGTETGLRFRGMRHFEIYENSFVYDGSTGVDTNMYLRGGTGVVFNNTVTGATTAVAWNTFIKFSNFRSLDSYIPWGKCDGFSAYDQNQEGEDGYRCVDQIGAGTSNLIGNDPTGPPVNKPTPEAWVENTLDPAYVWNNDIGGTPTWGDVAGEVHILENRDFYEDTPRPGYTPFQYPHPLVAIRRTKRGRVKRSF